MSFDSDVKDCDPITAAPFQKLKVFFVSPAAEVYGSERSLLTLLSARNFEAEVACSPKGELERELTHLGIRVHPFEFGKYSVTQNAAWSLGFFLKLLKTMKSVKPNVVVINLDGNSPLVTMAAVLLNVPIVRFCRFEFYPPTRLIDRWCWTRANAVVCPSQHVTQQFVAWAKDNHHSRVYRLYEPHASAKSPQLFQKAIMPTRLAKDGFKIASIGRIHPGKRYEWAIEALAIIRSWGRHAELSIVGDHDGSAPALDYLNELMRLADQRGVRGSVSFTGRLSRTEITQLLTMIDVVVQPSESESFGLVLVEAWAQGVPTVCTDVAGCGEITRESGAGLVAPAGAVEVFAENIVRLIDNREQSRRMGQSGKEWVQSNCDPVTYAKRFTDIVTKVAKI